MIQILASDILKLSTLLNTSLGTSGVLVIFLLLLIILYYKFLTNSVNAPPRFPILLSIIRGKYDFVNKGPIELIQDGYKSLGDIFRIQLFHQSIVFLIGPQAHKIFFEAKEVYTFTIPVFGKNIVYDASPKIMQQQLRFVNKG
jgi:hypothetical protein